MHIKHYLQLFVSAVSNEDRISAKEGQEFAMKLMSKYNDYLKPWVLITKDKMKHLKIKRIDVILSLTYSDSEYNVGRMETVFSPAIKKYINAVIAGLGPIHSHFGILYLHLNNT